VKVSIVIAVYNEARTADALLERVWAQPLPGLTRELIIVESNSTDGSREIVAQFVARHASSAQGQVRVIHQDRPRGKGHAVREGFAAASGDIIMIQDADLEYEVSDYPSLLRPIVEGHKAFVLGSRHLGPASWKIRQFANNGLLAGFMNAGGVLFRVLFNLLFSVRLTDPTTMYKVFRANCLEGLSFGCNGFDFDFELLGKLIRAGYVPLEIPVSYKSRGFDEGKKIRILRDPVTWLLAIVRCRFSTVSLEHQRANKAAPGPNSPRGVTAEIASAGQD
jgi:glycosyltransferase involved in cell wall biosynthesis